MFDERVNGEWAKNNLTDQLNKHIKRAKIGNYTVLLNLKHRMYVLFNKNDAVYETSLFEDMAFRIDILKADKKWKKNDRSRKDKNILSEKN